MGSQGVRDEVRGGAESGMKLELFGVSLSKEALADMCHTTVEQLDVRLLAVDRVEDVLQIHDDRGLFKRIAQRAGMDYTTLLYRMQRRGMSVHEAVATPLRPRGTSLIGQTFGRLTVTGFAGRSRTKKPLWRCKCTCGTKNFIVLGPSLKGNFTRSCGCLLSESSSRRARERRTWTTFIGKTLPSGILILGEGDRVGLVKVRCPCGKPFDIPFSNLKRPGAKGTTTTCGCWIRRITFEGQSLTIAQAARRAGITPTAMRRRVDKAAYNTNHSAAKPAPKAITYDVNGRELTATQIAAMVGVTAQTIRRRIDLGDRGAALLRKPTKGRRPKLRPPAPAPAPGRTTRTAAGLCRFEAGTALTLKEIGRARKTLRALLSMQPIWVVAEHLGELRPIVNDVASGAALPKTAMARKIQQLYEKWVKAPPPPPQPRRNRRLGPWTEERRAATSGSRAPAPPATRGPAGRSPASAR